MNYLVIISLSIVMISCQGFQPGAGIAASYVGHGLKSVNEKELKEFAPPSVDPDLAKRIERRMDLISPSGLKVTSDGKQAFFNWPVSGTSQVWRVSQSSPFPVQLTGGVDRTTLIEVIPERNEILVSRDVGGQENPGIYRVDYKTGELREVYVKAGVQTTPFRLDEARRYFYFSANDVKPDRYTFYRYDMRSEKVELFMEAREGTWFIADIAGDRFLLGNYRASDAIEYWLWLDKTKKLIPVLGQKERYRYSALFSATPDEYYVRTDHLSDLAGIYLFKEGKFKPLLEDRKAEVMSFTLNHSRTYLAVELNELGYSKARLFKTKGFRETLVPDFGGEKPIHRSVRFSDQNPNVLTLQYGFTKSPTRILKYDLSTKEKKEWTLPSTPEINTSHFREASLESYQAQDNTPIPVFVYSTEECRKKNCPVLVVFHGGPEGQSTPDFSPVMQMYLELGYVVAYPNVRGSTGYGKKWLDSDNGPKRLQVLTDIRDAGLHFRKWGLESGERKVIAMGGSYGGYSTYIAMTKFAGVFQGGIAVVGMSDLRTFLLNTAPYRRHLRISEYGDPDKDAEPLKELSAMNYLNQLKDPMLIIHGANDPRVPAGEAIQFYRQMQSRKIDGELVLFPDEGHGIVLRSNRVKYTSYVISFLKRFL